MDIEQLPAIPESLERGLWQREPALQQLLLSAQKRQHFECGGLWREFCLLAWDCPLVLIAALPRLTYW